MRTVNRIIVDVKPNPRVIVITREYVERDGQEYIGPMHTFVVSQISDEARKKIDALIGWAAEEIE